VLHCSDGTCYVGQTRDITRRYGQHTRYLPPVEHISFKPVSAENLDTCERETIAALESAGFLLLNIAHTHPPPPAADFASVMTPQDQQCWLDDVWWIDDQGERSDDGTLRARHEMRYRQFKQIPCANEIITVLRAYIRAAVPAYRRSEHTLWTCACLPTAGAHSADVCYAQVSICGLEVLTISSSAGRLAFSFYAALSPLQAGRALLTLFSAYPGLELTADATYIRGNAEPLDRQVYDILLHDPAARIAPVCARELAAKLPALFRKHPSLMISDHYWTAGGTDQAQFRTWHKDDTLKLIDDSEFRQAMRVYNLRLMQRGINRFSQNHCPAFVDDIVDR
jgi:hypothetical protein